MARRCGSVAVVAALALTSAFSEAGTVEELDLARGYSDYNTIRGPVFAAPGGFGVSIGAIEAGYDRDGQILRQLSKGMFTRGVKADIDPSIDLGALLADAMRAEAVTMGLPAGDADATWKVAGRLNDVFLESKQIPYGATLFYAYMDVTVTVNSPGGEGREHRMKLHNFFAGVNLGFSRKDEAADALLRFLVESAQEIVSRLNRLAFRLPPAPSIRAKLEAIPTSPELSRGDVRLVGLSGDENAVAVLLGVLPNRKAVRDRAEIIVALANLGSPAALEPLASRYDDEDEDCRFYTLKAFDYIGGERAASLVREKGEKDEDNACRGLAARLAK